MLYGAENREAAWKRVEAEEWDLIVVGGGITGAGILREAVRADLKVVLFEQNDFASGTSSRSSRLVHGGLRYLNSFQFEIARQSVHEREILLAEGEGLIESLPFVALTYEDDKIPAWMLEIGLYIYGWLGGRLRSHEAHDPQAVQMMVPHLAQDRLTGAFRFFDAQTDDARLVLRVLREGVTGGSAVALNYAPVENLLRAEDGRVIGVTACDRPTGRAVEVRAAAVVNATGAWADRLRGQIDRPPQIRPLRGSHLIFSQARFPVYQAITFPHPDDGRPVFAFPWYGVTLVGTTDIDHQEDLNEEPRISEEEAAYLLRAAAGHFPSLGLTGADVLATFAGVRPVIWHGEAVKPSRASREHAIWDEDGLLTVSGGKLTTFRQMAVAALKALRPRLPRLAAITEQMSALDPLPEFETPAGLSHQEALVLVARYGPDILTLARDCPPEELRRVVGLPVRWLEFRQAARAEAVNHLDDLLLRRVRIGLLVADGGREYLAQIKGLVQMELGWSDARWTEEVRRYLDRWQAFYSPPVGETTVQANG